MHRVEHATHVVLAEIYKWPRLDRVHEAALKDERQIEADNVVSDELVTIAVEVFHEVDEILKGLLFALFIAVAIDSKYVFARLWSEAGAFQSRNGAAVD